METGVGLILLDREMIDPSGRGAGGGLGGEDVPLRVLGGDIRIGKGLVVEPGDVDLGSKPVFDSSRIGVEASGGQASGVLILANAVKVAGELPTFLLVLLKDLVANGSHDHGGVIAVAANHVAQVSLMPGVEELVIPIRDLGYLPTVAGLDLH